MRKKLLLLSMLLLPINVNARTIVNMGEFKITYYCPCEICSEGYGRETATETYAEAGRTIAVDKNVIALGSKVLIDGKEYIAEDVGGDVKEDHIDIFVDTHAETLENGVKYKDVKIIKNED